MTAAGTSGPVPSGAPVPGAGPGREFCSSFDRVVPMYASGIVWDWEVDMRCASCANSSLIEIRMKVGGAPVTFRRCGRCEAQAWEALDVPVTLDHVLDLARP